MKCFANPATAYKYDRLGFRQSGIFLRLRIGNVTVDAVEHPKGVRLTFEMITTRSMSQYEAFLPENCSLEQIAGLIYANIAKNNRDNSAICRAHFEALGLPLFQ